MRRTCLFVMLAGMMAGCAEKPKYTPEQLANMPLARVDGLPDETGGLTLAVGTETISADDVIGPVFERMSQAAEGADYDQFSRLARPAVEQVLRGKISEALLYQQAKKEYGESAEEQVQTIAQNEVKKFVAGFGGDYARAEQAIKEMGMDWGSFEQYQIRMILSQSYMSEKMSKEQTVTHSELVAAYDQHKDQLYRTPAMMQFRLIDIEPGKLEVNDTSITRVNYARRLGSELVRRLNAGEDFAALAGQYSHGYAAQAGGLWGRIDPASLAQPYDVVADEAAKLKPGQIAGPIEAPGHVFIVQLVEYKPAAVRPFEEVQEELKAKIAFERRRGIFEKFNAELLQTASIGDRRRFVDYCIREIHTIANK